MKSWERFFLNNDGMVVMWQPPNVPIIGWFVCAVIGHLLSPGTPKTVIQFVGSAFFFTWSYLEIAQGENYFRRTLGGAAMIVLLASRSF